MKNNKYFLSIIHVVLFLFILAVGSGAVIAGACKGDTYSELEKRELEHFPEADIDDIFSGKYEKQLTDALTDHFYGRDGLVTGKTWCQIALGKREINDTYIAGNRLIGLYRDSDFDDRQISENISYLTDFMVSASQGVGADHVRLVLVPGKSTVYRDELPWYLPVSDRAGMLEDEIKKSLELKLGRTQISDSDEIDKNDDTSEDGTAGESVPDAEGFSFDEGDPDAEGFSFDEGDPDMADHPKTQLTGLLLPTFAGTLPSSTIQQSTGLLSCTLRWIADAPTSALSADELPPKSGKQFSGKEFPDSLPEGFSFDEEESDMSESLPESRQTVESDDAAAVDPLSGVSPVEASGDMVISLRQVMEAHKNEYIYYLTDHHWTASGAGYAYDEIDRSMDSGETDEQGSRAFADRSDARAPVKTKVVSKDFLGTDYNRIHFYRKKDEIHQPLVSSDSLKTGHDEVDISTSDVDVASSDKTGYDRSDLPASDMDVASPDNAVIEINDSGDIIRKTGIYDDAALKTADKYNYFLGGNYSSVVIHTGAGSGRTLLLVKDSYANSLIPYLCMDYETIIMVDPRYVSSGVTGYVPDDIKPDDVIIVYNEEKFMQDTHQMYLV